MLKIFFFWYLRTALFLQLYMPKRHGLPYSCSGPQPDAGPAQKGLKYNGQIVGQGDIAGDVLLTAIVVPSTTDQKATITI